MLVQSCSHLRACSHRFECCLELFHFLCAMAGSAYPCLPAAAARLRFDSAWIEPAPYTFPPGSPRPSGLPIVHVFLSFNWWMISCSLKWIPMSITKIPPSNPIIGAFSITETLPCQESLALPHPHSIQYVPDRQPFHHFVENTVHPCAPSVSCRLSPFARDYLPVSLVEV